MSATYLRKGQGKSDNAYFAQSQGIFPLTTAVKKIHQATKPYFKITQKTIRNWLEQVGPCEAHHVGKYANLCDYYDTEDILDFLLDVSCDDNVFIDEIDMFMDCPNHWEKIWMK